MELIGYISLAMMGFTLGTIGAGGSILTIPILVYLLKIPIVISTTYSLFIVGSSALIAAIRYRKNIIFSKAVLFIIPSITGVSIVRHYIIPNLPQSIGGLHIDQILVILLLQFMVLAGYFMIKKPHFFNHVSTTSPVYQTIKIILLGFFLGSIMGVLGAGGGFLIIPTLVLFMEFAMQEAVATSLFIITINSFVGFIADKHNLFISDWYNISKYLCCSYIGMMLGIYCAKFIKNKNLGKIFGYFIWIIAIIIFIKDFIY